MKLGLLNVNHSLLVQTKHTAVDKKQMLPSPPAIREEAGEDDRFIYILPIHSLVRQWETSSMLGLIRPTSSWCTGQIPPNFSRPIIMYDIKYGKVQAMAKKKNWG